MKVQNNLFSKVLVFFLLNGKIQYMNDPAKTKYMNIFPNSSLYFNNVIRQLDLILVLKVFFVHH